MTPFNLPRPQRPRDTVLSELEAQNAMGAAIRTARSLAADAQILAAQNRWPRAAALAVLALEEVGKIQAIARVYEAPDAKARRAAWKEYLSHPAKSGQSLEPGSFSDEVERKALKKGYGENLDDLKQLAVYSNLLPSGHWATPEEIVNRETALTILTIAEHMVGQLAGWENFLSGRPLHSIPISKPKQGS